MDGSVLKKCVRIGQQVGESEPARHLSMIETVAAAKGMMVTGLKQITSVKPIL